MRLKDGDTVSEGQAYAMLRAVWMKDKIYFDHVYRWSETHLSRQSRFGDPLLAWHWKDGNVTDPMPASDADLDYAFSLMLAEKQWPGNHPSDLKSYGSQARQVLEAILKLETFHLPSGRLYLSPWILDPVSLTQFPQNPSYYSPAYFRMFQKWTGDSRWSELVDTTYVLLSEFQASGKFGHPNGLVPDWCQIDLEGKISAFPGKSYQFGWDAVRMPFRIAWDVAWFHSPEALFFLNSGPKRFLENEWKEKQKLAAGYDLTGVPTHTYEQALFYAAYSAILTVTGSFDHSAVLEKTRSFLIEDEAGLYYSDPDDYFTNSLAWLSEVIDSPPEALLKK